MIKGFPMHTTRRATRSALALFAAAGLVLGAAACSSDDDEPAQPTGSTAGTTPGTTEGTTAPPPEVEVEYSFTETATGAQAEQAATVMTQRLDEGGYPGSEAKVNDDGTGLVIVVVGVSTTAQANAALEPLTVTGTVFFRPVMEGPLPPASNETASAATPDVVGSGTTLPADDQPTTPPDQDDPEGTVLLAQPDPRDDSVVARYLVGPEQVSGTTVESAVPTTQNGNPAVQIVFADTAEGLDAFNTLAEACKNETDVCPAGAYAVTFDGYVATASRLQPDNEAFVPFTQSNVIIWSELWTEEYADLLAAVISAGQLPVGLEPTA